MVHLFSTCKGYFSVILSSIHRDSFRLTEMHKLLCKDTGLHVLRYVFLYFPGLQSKVTLRSFRDLDVIRYYLGLLHAKLFGLKVNGFGVT